MIKIVTWLKYERALSVAPSAFSEEFFNVSIAGFLTNFLLKFIVGFSRTSSLKVMLPSWPMYLQILAKIILELVMMYSSEYYYEKTDVGDIDLGYLRSSEKVSNLAMIL